jgi:predicted nucleic acid-binding protein
LKAIVVDASVAIKWFIPEIHAEAAARIFQINLKLVSPELIFAEFGNILWKKVRQKELTFNNASAIFGDFKKLPLESFAIESLTDAAWQIAIEFQCTFYDSLYLALAQTEGCLLVTADRALWNILNKTKLASLLMWVEDIGL